MSLFGSDASLSYEEETPNVLEEVKKEESN
jgi:hypothetical protein